MSDRKARGNRKGLMLYGSEAEHPRRCSIRQRNTSRLGVRRVKSVNLVALDTE